MNPTTRTGSFTAFRTAKFVRSLLVPILLTMAVPAQTLDLPFLGPEKDFELHFPGELRDLHEDLRESISNELMQQKEENAVLQQYSSQHKTDRYQADIIRRMLRAQGYYGHKLSYRRYDGKAIYVIEPGPHYTVAELVIDFPNGLVTPDPRLLELRQGMPLRAEDVLAARNTLVDWIYLNLCLYQVQVDYQVLVYHRDHTASVTYTLAPSTDVRFGDLDLIGMETIEADYLRARLPLQKGDCFNRHHIDQARLALLQTNLVSSVNADIAPPQDNEVAVTFNVEERRHRTFRTGLGYDMDIGASASLGWEHRNLLGRAETLDISTRISEIGATLDSQFTVPHFRRPHQSLVLYANSLREKPDAYETTGGSLGAALTRQISKELFGSLGVKLRYSQVLEDAAEDDFVLFSTPFSLEFDRRDNLLNSQSGWRLEIALEPFADIRESERRFLKSRVSASAFHTEYQWRGAPTFAAKLATGTITGVARQEVPADLRFYVGGGGSVRGYKYQTLGDLTDGEPDGGRSYTELAFETRVRFSESWGAAVFLDGGYAYPEELPSFGQDLLWGAGLGLRYLTDFAPIRFDIAVPLDRREGIDDTFQLYISIGQAF
jgi:translocation and assembly module TamA